MQKSRSQTSCPVHSGFTAWVIAVTLMASLIPLQSGWAFEPDSALDVPATTEQSLSSAATVSGSSEFAVEYASETIFDMTSPQAGDISAPSHIQAAPIDISFTNAQDNENGSGVGEAALWLREGAAGSWVDTGQRLALNLGEGAGSFQYTDLLGEGEYFFAVTVTDRAGNASPAPSGDVGVRTILDNSAPVITLLPPAIVTLEAGAPYVDPGATASDTRDGDLTGNIDVTNNVDTSTPGTYIVAYNVQDQAGNAAQEVQREVVVAAPSMTYALNITQPDPAQGAITAAPAPNAADGRYSAGTEVTLTFSPTADYDLGSWLGVQADPGTPMAATVLMDSNKAVSVNVVRATGTVDVQVTPDTATWTVTDGDGANHNGTGDSSIRVPTGNVSIAYNELSGYETPAGESSLLERGGTVNFVGAYVEGMDYAISAPRSLSGSPGDSIDCPVSLNTGDGVTGYSFQMSFDSTLLEVQGVEGGGLTGGWPAPSSSPASGSVQVSSSGPALGSGGGTVAIITFKIKDTVSESGSSELTFGSVSLSTASGSAGTVNTEAGLIAVEMGEFRWGDADGDNTVNSADATALLRLTTGIISELPVTQEAGDSTYLGGADVSGDDPPKAGAYDAALILQQIEGMRETFPADLNADGLGPDLTEGAGAAATLADMLVGEIDKSISRVIRMHGALTLDPGTTIDVPIGISAAARVLSYKIQVNYDPAVLTFVSVSKGNLTEAWLSPIINSDEAGQLTFAAAGAQELDGSGELASLTFRVGSAVAPGQTTQLQFGDVNLNDGALPIQLEESVATPKLNNLSPTEGADLGGTVVELKGLNLAYVDTVYFGNVPSQNLIFIPESASIMAVSPPGTGVVDVTVSAVGQESTRSQGFTYFPADIRLTLWPAATAQAGEVFPIPVTAELRDGSNINRVAFTLHYDRKLFAALETGKTSGVVTIDTAESPVTSFTAQVRKPGELFITVDGEIQDGVICAANLIAMGATEDTESILYISDVEAEGPAQKAATAAGSAAVVGP